jgi:membrane protein implicated in regulation of membrane protease activity
MNSELDQKLTRQGRAAGVVIAVGGLLAITAPWLTNVLGLPMRFEMLFYLISLAAFVWALAVTLQIRRKRQENQG